MAFRRQVKNFVKNYSDAEIKVREATSNDPWGPSSSLMLDISDLTFNTISLSEIMNMLWHRLNDHGKNWRHVYKSLTLMDYLIKNGSKKVIQHCREGFCNLQTLKDFQHIDEAGKDQENVCKAGLKQEHCQDVHLPTETMLSQETLPLKIHGWKSTEDLMTFLDDDPELPLLATPPSIVSPITCLSEAEEVCNLSGADAVPTLSENSPSGQTDVSLDKRSDETLCLSPSFKIFDRVKEIVINKAYQKPAQSSIQMDDKILKTTTRVSTASEGASSFSPLSMSSPDLASPEKSAPLLSPILAGPSFWTLSHQQLSSTSFKDEDKTAKLHHSFASRGPVSSDVEENDSLNLLGILPNNSDSAKKNISHISSSHWGEFSTQNVDQFIPLSCSGFQSTKDFPQEPEAKNSISVLLREVKRAIARLHEDLSTVILELNVINNILMSMSLNSSQISQSSQVPQSSERSSDQI
nr:ENTH domain-containing protein 1 isoform X11 [Pan paniscus]XP_054962051.1 ENTH domain-containing protein 1 isoform X11 [Pan paniscus]